MRLKTAPTAQPITIAQAQEWLRGMGDAEPLSLAIVMQACTEKAEEITGRRLMPQVWVLSVTAGQLVPLYGLDPVVSARMADGTPVPVVDGLPSSVIAPADGELEVTCGYSAADAVPAAAKLWMLQRLGFYWTNRDALLSGRSVEPPRDYVDGLLDPITIPRL